jgi:hypothetical protein
MTQEVMDYGIIIPSRYSRLANEEDETEMLDPTHALLAKNHLVGPMDNAISFSLDNGSDVGPS